MTTPNIAAARFLGGMVIGLALGVWYGFLRPLGKKRRNFADLLFLVALFPAWIYLSFGICQGDLRPGYWAALFLGGWLWDRTAGRLLQPVWALFWRVIGFAYGKTRKIFHKIRNFLKKIFTSLGKLSTMMLYRLFRIKSHAGGKNRDRTTDAKKCPAGKKAQQQNDQGGGMPSYRVVYGDPSGAAFGDTGCTGTG